ncbi:MAG: ribose-5-phosphate isomerase [Actinomycetota bacterium]|nr:ribose-5-phosphate isomerase [Actinomycetota bacterium]MDQ2959394.1 ribose-5-phosphate isomerase [Actinomycetota bacterium]
MRVYLGSDHAGFELKAALVEHLTSGGHQVTDCGPDSYQPTDDYPPHCISTAQRVVADPGSLGIVLGGSGNGEQIAANKVTGVRAALGYNLETATLARQHNDANVLGLGARMHDLDEAISIVDAFVGTPFSQDPRHVRRIAMLTAFEQTGSTDLP